ncbi:pyrroline-5-carboxylate reductase [Thermoanaerobacterium thermosaccharolyticum]|jgi:pyrroline-5-carboxylate reductase|uniref:Pyrroline-5-carboxylate reductase n=2 Tax=Thermoanaerobacterium thermosaccharolyticum TaxID=1517 RepID=D9TTC0_THETC|nr:pyrroline-5-carboxylate reductase [Thermoanaerobacterium thermosaccharolyticum]TCW38609.1 pyrroline-5-carboxylate reductase [Thermohydrogenium kirishiense]ADL68886.1 pyrroline-5-carboxylate reductase [Thermoanaerobacterium thermosaccharolyticum DSM 571]AST59072.1 pyrroline-5-carboxylate reductase [Thermoanaerobacterium thermosaccharolyticum]KAA5807696.1 pyrroline-5-carboxylate reductase [Thermoanaerobacterium thermosaccharolyticum]MCP2239243.1 pyrroline-5-carboxylate reductase [Thermoanaero
MKIGFIGTGNMGTALIKGLINSKYVPSNSICAFDISKDKLMKLKEELGINIGNSNKEIAKECDVIILAIKPNVYNDILLEIKDDIDENKIIIIIAPGITIESVKNILRRGKVVRTIPNTPALIGEGVTAISYPENISSNDKEIVEKIFRSCGEVVEVKENLIDAAMAISSCSPAFVYMFIESLADAGVSLGLPRDVSYKLASKAVSGSGSMVLETGMHPGYLKDMVTSPGGTTIQGVRTLERLGLRSALFEAVISSYEKVKGN